MTGLLDMYFPAEDPMAPAALFPQGLLGPSVLSRMQQHSDAQRARMTAGDYSPTRMDEDAMWLADDVAGGLLGSLPGGLMVLGAKALPMDQASRLARAREMGFDTETPLYHGTTRARQIRDEGFKKGWTHLTDAKEIADSYLAWDKGASPETLELYTRLKNPALFDAAGAKYTDIGNKVFGATYDAERAGHDGIIIKNIRDHFDSSVPVSPHTTYVVFDPKNIRSVHAAFDPAKRDSADLLAGMAGLSGLGLLAGTQYPYQEPAP